MAGHIEMLIATPNFSFNSTNTSSTKKKEENASCAANNDQFKCYSDIEKQLNY
jgi:hypothetical protein